MDGCQTYNASGLATVLLSWLIIILYDPDWNMELVARVVSVIKKGTCVAFPPKIFEDVAAFWAYEALVLLSE